MSELFVVAKSRPPGEAGMENYVGVILSTNAVQSTTILGVSYSFGLDTNKFNMSMNGNTAIVKQSNDGNIPLGNWTTVPKGRRLRSAYKNARSQTKKPPTPAAGPQIRRPAR